MPPMEVLCMSSDRTLQLLAELQDGTELLGAAPDDLPEATGSDRRRERPNHEFAKSVASVEALARTAELQAAMSERLGDHETAAWLRARAHELRTGTYRRAVGAHDTERTYYPAPKSKATRITRDPVTSGSGRFLEKPVTYGSPARLANVTAEAEQDRWQAKHERNARREAKRLANRSAREAKRR